jgi:HK97 gp10 family phage protein
VNMKLVGAASLKGKLAKMSAAMGEGFELAVIAGALVVMNDAKKAAPYKTGNLRGSIHIGEVMGLGQGGKTEGTDIGGKEVGLNKVKVDVGTNVIYAAMQEFGGSTPTGGTIPPHPYLRPALDNNKEKVKIAMSSALRNILGRM